MAVTGDKFYIVAESRDGNKHSIALSNTPDFPNQDCEEVFLIRPRCNCNAGYAKDLMCPVHGKQT